jgi:cardiolipin synthase (CMP-forming)
VAQRGAYLAQELLSPRTMWLANALTLSRIPLAVVFWLTYGDLRWSLSLVALAALTDAADGTVARWARRRAARTRGPDAASASTAGEWLDPLADKFFIVVVLAAIQVHDPAPWWIIGLIVAREIVLVPLAAIYRLVVRGRGEHAFQAQAVGKAATIAELAAIIALILRSVAVVPLAIMAATLGILAVVSYIVRATHDRAGARPATEVTAS